MIEIAGQLDSKDYNNRIRVKLTSVLCGVIHPKLSAFLHFLHKVWKLRRFSHKILVVAGGNGVSEEGQTAGCKNTAPEL